MLRIHILDTLYVILEIAQISLKSKTDKLYYIHTWNNMGWWYWINYCYANMILWNWVRYCKDNSKGKKLDIKINILYESIYIKYKIA